MFSFGLNPILIKLIQRIIEGYATRHGGKRNRSTERLTTEASEKQAKYEARIAVARKEAGEKREALRNEGRQSERELVEGARERADVTIANGRSEIDNQATEVRSALQTEVDTLATQLAAKVLGRELA